MRLRLDYLKKLPWAGILTVISTFITGSWLADGLKGEALFIDWFPVLKDYQIIVTFVILMLFLASFFWLFYHRQSFYPVRRLSQHPCEPHAYLILLLTSPNISLPSPFTFPLKVTDRHGKTATLDGKSLRSDILALNSLDFWNWQQVMRGLEPHTNLQRVYLIGSADSKRIKGSFYFMSQAEALIKQYLPSVKKVDKVNEPINFEDFEKLVKTIEDIIEIFKKEGLKEKDIIIDITGGQKIPSIAGAAVTLRREVTFQYVRTDPVYDDIRDVQAYDVIIQSPASL
ncbi:MAG: hypothetical protein HY578_02645 [Nitrospinae bacterium]|nr:hypothetical protein [Nitrospinota bacterium]